MSSVEVEARELLITTEQINGRRPRGSGAIPGGHDPKHVERVFEAFYRQSPAEWGGAVDLPIHHRCPWGPAVGGCE